MTSCDDTSDEGASYIRGGGAVVNSRRTTRVLVAFCILVLVTLTVVLTVEAVRENSRSVRLRQHGVPVDVTVTSCIALASGTGITASGFRCTGTFMLNGHRYSHAISGTTDFHPVGESVQAVTDPRDPTILVAARAAATTHAPRSAFIAPTIALSLLLLLVVLVVWRSRHRAHPAAPDQTAPGPMLPGRSETLGGAGQLAGRAVRQ